MNKEIDETITFIDIFLKNIELEKRIDKAIEFLNEECFYDKDLGYCDDLWCGDIPKLIKILKEEEKNEKEK